MRPLPTLLCILCSEKYLPDIRHIRRQKHCSEACRKSVKRVQDKKSLEKYRKTTAYKQAKRMQNKRYRARVNWKKKMALYRETRWDVIKGQNIEAAKRYYQKNKRKIAFRRSERRLERILREQMKLWKELSQ